MKADRDAYAQSSGQSTDRNYTASSDFETSTHSRTRTLSSMPSIHPFMVDQRPYLSTGLATCKSSARLGSHQRPNSSAPSTASSGSASATASTSDLASTISTYFPSFHTTRPSSVSVESTIRSASTERADPFVSSAIRVVLPSSTARLVALLPQYPSTVSAGPAADDEENAWDVTDRARRDGQFGSVRPRRRFQ